MPSLRALSIPGNGKSFCTGADIAWMEQSMNLNQLEKFLRCAPHFLNDASFGYVAHSDD